MLSQREDSWRNKSYNLDEKVQVYEWMDGCGLLLEAMVFSLESSLSLFFETWSPLSLSFFLGHASLACNLFSFWGNYNLTLFISGMFYERDHQDMEHLLMEDEWMICSIPNTGM